MRVNVTDILSQQKGKTRLSSVSAGRTLLGNPILQTCSTVNSSVTVHCWSPLTTDLVTAPSLPAAAGMAKGKKNKQTTKSKTITLKMAQSCVTLTLDGKRCLDLSFKEISAVPKCIQKLCEINELDLSRNLIRKVPDFIDHFTAVTVLDLHSNYVSTIEDPSKSKS